VLDKLNVEPVRVRNMEVVPRTVDVAGAVPMMFLDRVMIPCVEDTEVVVPNR